ncbi:MAG: helix-turn-helix domain-containing protein [Candidatus Latescibacteria bacterium]|nr:helix-turn-helix domain-containing protein [Candidatus Latescibacterota bacterium]
MFILSTQIVYSKIPDTTPPSYTWLHPQQYSIITTNTIRLSVDAHDDENGSGVNKVIFFAQYYDSHATVPKQIIGEVDNYPYEFVWKCSQIPDQNLGKLSVFCHVYDNAGNISIIPKGKDSERGPEFVLDRNPQWNESKIISYNLNKDIIIDGSLAEWAPKDSVVFTNNDNKITVYSAWNKEKVFFGIKVDDRSVISTFGPESENIDTMSNQDDIELWIDTNHDHYEIFTVPDIAFLMSPAGMIYKHTYNIDKEFPWENDLAPSVDFKATVTGTLNISDDEDECYIFELAIPWSELGYTDGKTINMGLEIWNNDKDFCDGTYFYSAWTTTASNLKNPSEWGNIVFICETRLISMTTLALFITFSSIVCVFIFLKIKRGKEPEAEDDNLHIFEKENIKKARIYIEEHLSEERLSRKEVSAVIGLTPSYFGKLFKKETGLTFSEFVTNLRINKAKIFLSESNKNISEIAFSVGFKSLSHFGYVFKHIVKKSPKEYRHSVQKK